MTTDNQNLPATVETETFSGSATYSPEDNKLRLYIGRVPRDEYLKLRADGWVALHKQRETGGGDFAATWTPSRRDTALKYAGIIDDEDMGPEERAADRAERFGGYRDKRTGEAVGTADRFDAGPAAHGYQSAARAERAAARHDRIAGRAVDSWGKAEYWQRRTAGVISHALYKSSPSVRMGRIKTIEADLRKTTKTREEYADKWKLWKDVAAITDTAQQNALAERIAGAEYGWSHYKHPVNGREGSLWDFMREDKADRITGAQACELYFAAHTDPESPEWGETRLADWVNHYNLRLAYENQMIEAQGGRAAFVEMVPGGKIGGLLIVKVNKSPATGRVVSVFVKGPRIERHAYKVRNVTGADYSLHQVETERLATSAYTAPTAESLAELEALNAARKAATPKNTCPLINPTFEDAEHLQKLWNMASREPAQVLRMTQAEYSARSGGNYSSFETVTISEHGTEYRDRCGSMSRDARCAVFKVRKGPGGGFNTADRVIIITDKPQKALLFDKMNAARAKQPTAQTMRPKLAEIKAAVCEAWLTDKNKPLLEDAAYIGWVTIRSMSQMNWTEQGIAELKQFKSETVNA
jgi:hypothetical protein